MNLIVARWLQTHTLHTKRDVPAFDVFCRWVRSEFGIVPSRRALIGARCQLVDLCPPDDEEEQP